MSSPAAHAFALIALVVLPPLSPFATVGEIPRADAPASAERPGWFEANLGQADERTRFVARSGTTLALLSADGAAILTDGVAFRMTLVGADPRARAAPGAPLAGASSYYLGNDPDGWVEGAPHHAEVTFLDVLPGVDVRWWFRGDALEFDLELDAGADPSSLRLAFPGALPALDDEGALVVRAHGATLGLAAPVSYQPTPGGSRSVASAYALEGALVGFRLGARAEDAPLVIDPLLVSSGSFGGAGADSFEAVAVAGDGQLVLLGATTSSDLPATPDAAQRVRAGAADLFVARMSPAGGAPTYLTYLGGARDEDAGDIELDADGNAYLVGSTSSPDFPLRNDCGSCSGASIDAAVAKITPAGGLAYSSRFGGTDDTHGFGIAVAADGTATIVGDSRGAAGFPFQNAWDSTFDHTYPDSFVARFTPAGAVVFASFLAGGGGDSARGVALAPTGEAVVVGDIGFSNFGEPFPGVCPYEEIGGAAYVVFLRADGAGPRLSRCFGGRSYNSADDAYAVAVDARGNVHVAGETSATDWPPGARPGAWFDAYLASIAANGTERYAVRLGGAAYDSAFAVAVGLDGVVFVAGTTASSDFPLKGATQTTRGGAQDAFVASVSQRGILAFSTYLGGSGAEAALGAATDTTGALHVVGGGVAGAGGDALLAAYAGTTGAPTSLVVTPGAGAGEMDLTWGPPTSAVGPIVGYDVHRSIAGGAWTLRNATTALSFTDTGLPAGAQAAYVVRALTDPGGAGAEAIGGAYAFSPPTAPRETRAARGEARGEITLGWEAPQDTDGLPVLSYRLFWGDRAGARIPLADVAGDARSYVHAAQPDNATRWYVVRAVTAAGTSPESAQASARTMGTPWAPRNVTGEAGPGLGEATVRWGAPADDGGRPVLGHRIFARNASGALAPVAEVSDASRTWTEHGLAPGAARIYVVRAVNELGVGDASVEATTRAAAPPGAPTLSAPITADVDTRIAWTTPDAGGLALTSFVVHRRMDGGAFDRVAVVPPWASGWRDTACPIQRACEYRVLATNALGEGPLSNAVSDRGGAFQPVLLPDEGPPVYNDADRDGAYDPGEGFP